MSQLMNHVEYLSKEIGPRPAGTEEEQQAALYITEQFQKETGFAASMEDFASSSNVDGALAVLAGVTVLATVLAIIFPVLAIPTFILAAAAAVVYSLELFDRPIVSRVLSRGASQNVVAKYQPGADEAELPSGRRSVRSRKVILVAHYDTGRVTPPLVERLDSSGLPVSLACVVAMIAAAFFLLLRIFMAPGGGMGLLVLNVLSVLALIVCLVPIVKALLSRSAPYNEGATNNASGVAVLIEVARRIARGSVSEADLVDAADDSVTIHGEAAAIEAGLVPEGVQLRYEAEQIEPPSELGEYSEEERILSAKAAIAALTGQSVERRVFGSVAENLVNSRVGEMPADMEFVGDGADGAAMAGAADAGLEGVGAAAASAVAAYEPTAGAGAAAEGFENAPSWFVAAQQNAKKSERFNADEAPQIKRSRYTEAMENAERERRELEEEMRAAEQAEREAALRAREEEARAALAAGVADGGTAVAEVADLSVDATGVAAAEQGAGALAGTPAATPAAVPAADLFELPDMPDMPDLPDLPVVGNAVLAEIEAATGAGAPAAEGGQGPDGTMVMGAPVPAAEVLAEAGLADIGASADDGAVAGAAAQGAEGPLSALPAIDAGQAGSPEPVKSPSRSGILRNLRANVPSLSGLISPVKANSQPRRSAADNQAARRAVASVPSVEPTRGAQPSQRQMAQQVPAVQQGQAQAAGQRVAAQQQVAPAQAQAQAAQAQVQAQPQAQAQPDLVSIGAPTESRARHATQGGGAHASRERVEVPRSRSGNLLNRLKRNDGEELSDTPQQWLDVDDDFEARSVGRARGGWESFRDDQYFDEDDDFGDFAAGDDSRSGRRWQGGAFGGRVQVGHADTRSGVETEPAVVEVPPADVDDQVISEEIEQIYHFRNPQFDTEIWFVAMGADGESHDGARAFIEEHRDELRGSMIIEIESLGAGALSVASEEGRVRKVKASSRVKRYTRNATAATGIALDTVSLAGTDSISSTLQKAGFQTMHLFGAEGGRPALKGSADDVAENVDEMLLDEHLNYVFELLKH